MNENLTAQGLIDALLAGEQVQYYQNTLGDSSEWWDLTNGLDLPLRTLFKADKVYRIKPKQVTLPEVTLPAAIAAGDVDFDPENQEYYTISAGLRHVFPARYHHKHSTMFWRTRAEAQQVLDYLTTNLLQKE